MKGFKTEVDVMNHIRDVYYERKSSDPNPKDLFKRVVSETFDAAGKDFGFKTVAELIRRYNQYKSHNSSDKNTPFRIIPAQKTEIDPDTPTVDPLWEEIREKGLNPDTYFY